MGSRFASSAPASRIRLALLLALLLWLHAGPAAALSSQFLAADAGAAQVMAGTPYDMNDPAWLAGGKQNRSVFAYKIFSALFMLGYQTEPFQHGSDQVNAFKDFQTRNGFAANGVLDAAALTALDAQLAQRETLLAALAAQLPAGLYAHIRTPAANDVSLDTIAALQALTQSQLPAALHMSAAEMVQCIYGQCNGWIKAADGAGSVPFPVDLNSDYRFILSYFDPLVANARFPGAAVAVETNLHEYAHYLDGFYYGLGGMYTGNFKTALQPHFGLIDTRGFYDINYDITTGSQGCFTKRSDDPKDWISLYGYTNYGDKSCAPGKGWPFEEWAEAFQMYVTAGRGFRAAALHSAKLAQKYAWLKSNVFGGIEYDTDLAQAANSGCDDLTGRGGTMRCRGGAPWDFSLPHGPVNGACGPADGIASVAAPAANLCGAGAPGAVGNDGNWNWSCAGLNGGSGASCGAPILTGDPPGAPLITNAVGGNTQASITFDAPAPGSAAIDGYTVLSDPPGGTDADAGSTALTHTVTGLTNGAAYTFTVKAHNLFGEGPASAPSAAVTPAWSLVSEGFDNVTPTALPPGWQSLIHLHADGAWQTNAGSHAPAGIAPHSGANLVYFNSNAAAAGGSAMLISPAFSLDGVSSARLSFWMYRDESTGFKNDRIEVYLSTQPTAASIFGTTPLLSIPRIRGFAPTVPAAGWYEYSAAIPPAFNGTVNYLIFDGISAGGGNDIHLDDITIAIPPGAPSISAASGGNAQATLAITPPLSNGGSAITGYTVSSNPPGGVDADAGSTALTHTVTGLANGIAYTFTVSASNAAGAGAASAPSASVIPLGAPAAPLLSAASALNAAALLSFNAPADDGGAGVTGYSATCAPAGGGAPVSVAGGGTPILVAPLANGSAYACSVRAANGEGSGPPSNAMNVTPGAAAARVVNTSHSPDPSLIGQPVAVGATLGPAQPAQRLAAGGDHACLLDAAGAVRCWGRNDRGQLGDGSTIDRPAPVAVAGLPGGVTALAGGQSHSCALAGGTVWCWGDNESGQLGADPAATPYSATPLAVAGLSGIVALAAGYDFNCALGDSGAVKCWGNNGAGQLGNGHPPDGFPAPTPQPVTVDFSGVAPSSGLAAIGAGWAHACAIDGAGKLFCWGWNNSGQLGDGTLTPRGKPVAVQMPAGFAAAATVGAGLEHTCALSAAGGVWCWGGNAADELGDGGQLSYSTTPLAVAALASGVVALAAGTQHNCAVDGAGAVWCWGFGWFANPGPGNQNPASPMPVSPAGLAFAAVASGNWHGCAATAGGAVQCWGRNDRGQLGDGALADRTAFGNLIGYAIPTGNVTLGDGGASCQFTLPAAGCNLTPASAGAKTLSALYGGDAVYAGAQSAGVGHTVSRAASSLTLGAAPNPSVFGQNVTFTASVTGYQPGGTVRFSDGANTLCEAAPLIDGQASCGTAALSVGAHTISAVYAGDAANTGASGGMTQTVNRAATALSITGHTPHPSALGAQVTVTVALSVLPPGAGTPGGTITIGDGSTQCVATLPALACALTPGGSGTRTLSAAYGGDARFAFSTAPGVAHTVNPAPGGVTLTSSRNPSVFGKNVTFTASISGNAPGGTVNFVDGAAGILPGCAARPVNGGQATCAAGALSVGIHQVTAQYSGDGTHPAATSQALAQKVLAKPRPAVPIWLLLLLE